MNRFIINPMAQNHTRTSLFQSVWKSSKNPNKRHIPDAMPSPKQEARFLGILLTTNSAAIQPIISLTPNMTWLMVLLKPTSPRLRVVEQQMVWMPMKMNPVATDIQRRLLYLKRSFTPTSLPYYTQTQRGRTALNYSSDINYFLFILPIQFSSFRVRPALFSIRYIGVSFRHSSKGIWARMNSPNSMPMIARQSRSDRKIRAMVDYPSARPICTPTPNLCLDLPRLCSLMKEKASVMAGLVPNPMKNSPNPMMRGESAITVATRETMPTIHATRRAVFLPELSAILGMTKNPTSAPKKSMDCRMGICPPKSSQIMQSSNSKAMEREWVAMARGRSLEGRRQTYSRQASSERPGLKQVKESSKKKDMPRRSHEVRNHSRQKTRKVISWNLPYPPTLCSSRSTGDNLESSTYGFVSERRDGYSMLSIKFQLFLKLLINLSEIRHFLLYFHFCVAECCSCLPPHHSALVIGLLWLGIFCRIPNCRQVVNILVQKSMAFHGWV